MKPIPPPEYLPADALPAWTRITDRLRRRGEWWAGCEGTAAAAAMACLSYCRLVAQSDRARATETEELRRQARLMLFDMEMLEENRVPLAPLDADGNDAELIAICRPLDP